MLPPTLPLFPLPNVVLFPGVYLPLHIFEPRYRDMTRDALAGDRLIGMVLLRSGWEEDYDGRPAVYEVGCAGLITHAESLPDGRYHIVLQGLERFRVQVEDGTGTYRQAHVQALPEPSLDTGNAAALRQVRQQLESLLVPLIERVGSELAIPAAMPDGDLVHALAQYLELESIEKQALLEIDGVLARARALAELLEMKALLGRQTRPTAWH